MGNCHSQLPESEDERPALEVARVSGGGASASGTEARPQKSNGSSDGTQLIQHPNKPLRIKEWAAKDGKSQTWTREKLDKERVDFFDTRVTGNIYIWQAIRSALEVLWEGGDAMDEDGGLNTAQQIIDAAGINLPTGYLHKGAYDETGIKYEIPIYIVNDPRDIATTGSANLPGSSQSPFDTQSQPHHDFSSLEALNSQNEALGFAEDHVSSTQLIEGKAARESGIGRGAALAGIAGGRSASQVATSPHTAVGELDSKEIQELLKRRAQKGKSRADDMVEVRARRHNAARDLIVQSVRTENVKVLKQQFLLAYSDIEKSEAPLSIRLFHNGRELDNDKPLRDQRWEEGQIILAMIT
ncbi:hypothetical protein B0O99DRAFT_614268 [Bisporella sp. PMI_857]|nr:hypothetical protein B0O99DRAFT_614268 [Bisporella sp. PMI_857]